MTVERSTLFLVVLAPLALAPWLIGCMQPSATDVESSRVGSEGSAAPASTAPVHESDELASVCKEANDPLGLLEIPTGPMRTVRGRCVDTHGTAVEGATVSVIIGKAMSLIAMPWLPPDVRTDTDGRFETHTAKDGMPHAVRPQRAGLATCTFAFDEGDRDVVELDDLPLPRAASIRGRIVDPHWRSGMSVPVGLAGGNRDWKRLLGHPDSSSMPMDTWQRCWTDGLGRFAFDDVAPGEHDVSARIDGMIGEATLRIIAEEGSQLRGVELLLDSGLSIEGRVTDESGAGIRMVEVRAISPDHTRWCGSTYTDENGHYRVLGLSDEPLTLLFSEQPAEKARHARTERTAIAAGGRNVDVQLHRADSIVGRVAIGELGSVVGGVVRARSRSGEPDPFEVTTTTQEGPVPGLFVLEIPPDRVVDLVIAPPGVGLEDVRHCARLERVRWTGECLQIRVPSK